MRFISKITISDIVIWVERMFFAIHILSMLSRFVIAMKRSSEKAIYLHPFFDTTYITFPSHLKILYFIE